mgnify:FL=1
MVNIQCKYNDNFPNAQIATIGDINWGKYPHFAIVGFEIMPHLCSVENRPRFYCWRHGKKEYKLCATRV